MTTRFSIIIPTRDKLTLLREAVTSVLEQTCDDFELVVSDNASSEDVEGYVAGLRDPRVRYVRTPAPLAVTESWNFAVSHAAGEYLILLGNDDGLRPTHLARMSRLIDEHEADVVCSRYLRFAYPAVDPSRPDGYLDYGGASHLLAALREPRLLAKSETTRAVELITRFKQGVDFNLQAVVFRRALGDADGVFFRGPYPDFYMVVKLLTTAERVVGDPVPTVVVGMSPGSMHDFILNDRADEGEAEYLGNSDNADVRRYAAELVPGSHFINSWYVALVLALRGRPDTPQVDIAAYRRRQFLTGLTVSLPQLRKPDSRRALRGLVAAMSGRERARYGATVAAVVLWCALGGTRRRAELFNALGRRITLDDGRIPAPITDQCVTLLDACRVPLPPLLVLGEV